MSDASTTPAPLDAVGAGQGAAQLVDRLLVEHACFLVRPQNARTSVLSGRSAMTRLSVFRRRRMYGRTSSRSGP